MNWGDRALEAEIVDGRGRKTLSLGDGPEELLRAARSESRPSTGALSMGTWASCPERAVHGHDR